MKVLIVGPLNSPIIGRLINNMQKEGVDILVASHDVIESDQIINLGKLKAFRNYLSFFKINTIVRKYKPDLVHAHVVNHYGLMCLLQPKPLLVALWGSDVMIASHKGSYVKKKIYQFINWLVLKRATRCHTSAFHVADEAERQCKGVLRKTDVFYWGFPLDKPSDSDIQAIQIRLAKEFGLVNDELIVFPRGLANVYNPRMVATIINKLLLKTQFSKKIVVLKGFASQNDEIFFKSLVDIKLITYVDRLLTSGELYFLYSNTNIHFSIPVSDSLGGGVIEPALFGSYPVLSNLPSYKIYSKTNKSLILNDYNDDTLERLCELINKKQIGKSIDNKPSAYTKNYVVRNFVDTYQKTLVND